MDRDRSLYPEILGVFHPDSLMSPVLNPARPLISVTYISRLDDRAAMDSAVPHYLGEATVHVRSVRVVALMETVWRAVDAASDAHQQLLEVIRDVRAVAAQAKATQSSHRHPPPLAPSRSRPSPPAAAAAAAAAPRQAWSLPLPVQCRLRVDSPVVVIPYASEAPEHLVVRLGDFSLRNTLLPVR